VSRISRSHRQASPEAAVKDQANLCKGSGDAGASSITRNTTFSGALPTSVHHPGKTPDPAAFAAIAATESSSIVTRHLARCEGLSYRTSSRKVWKSCRRTSSWSGREQAIPDGEFVERVEHLGSAVYCSASWIRAFV